MKGTTARPAVVDPDVSASNHRQSAV